MATCMANVPLPSKFSSLTISNKANFRPNPHHLSRKPLIHLPFRQNLSWQCRKKITKWSITCPKALRLDNFEEEEEEGEVEEEEKEEEEDEFYDYDEDDDEGFGFRRRADSETAAAYEARYGPAYSGTSVLGNDVYELGLEEGRSREGPLKMEDEFDETVVHMRRVCKVLQGGQRISFRAVVVVGDRKGRVGVGKGKALETIDAIRKGALQARKRLIRVPITKHLTFPHRVEGRYCGATVMLRPGAPGSGLRAGLTVRTVLELAGYESGLGKQLRSRNHLNNARAAVVALSKLMTFREVSERRGIPMEELWK